VGSERAREAEHEDPFLSPLPAAARGLRMDRPQNGSLSTASTIFSRNDSRRSGF